MTHATSPAHGLIEAQLVLVSDVHLRLMADERGTLLLDALSRLGPGVEFLILNGDIFDFCCGDNDYYRAKYASLGGALSKIAASGTRVLFIEGNHEIQMTHVGWSGVEVIVQRDYVVTLSTGERIKISHGDLLKGDPLYKAFRGLIKSDTARVVGRHLPGRWIDAYAMRHASISRSQDKYRKLDHEAILGSFERWLTDGTYDHGIVGHYHVPYAEPRKVGKGLILCVDSWDHPNLLVYRTGKFERLRPATAGKGWAAEEATSLFGSARSFSGSNRPVPNQNDRGPK